MTTPTTIADRLIIVNDRIIPPVIGSVVFWKKALTGEIAEFTWLGKSLQQYGFTWGGSHTDYMDAQNSLWGRGHCAICDGLTTVNYTYGYYHCLCGILEKRYELSNKQALYGSSWSRQTIDGMKIAGPTREDTDELKRAINTTRAWIKNPDRWLVYSGKPGTGKSRFLQSIMAEWWPYSLYIVASDFENRLRENLSKKDDDNGIPDFINTLINHPILIIDDWGIEYGTPWIQQKMDSIIENRNREAHWWERLTLVGTNIGWKVFSEVTKRKDGVSRSGSRLDDIEKVEWLHLNGTDFRSQKR